MPELAQDVGVVASQAELFAQVHPHLRETWIEKESRNMVAIAQDVLKKNPDIKAIEIPEYVENDKALLKQIQNHVTSYSWSTINKWYGEPLSKEQAYKRLTEEVENCRQNNHIKAKHEPTPESELDAVIGLSISTSYWRAECGRVNMRMAERFRSIMLKIGEKNGTGYELGLLLSADELVKTIRDPEKKIKDSNAIGAREKEYFCFVTKDAQEIILSSQDKEYAQLVDLFVPKENVNQSVSELQGIGASPGKVTGIVRIIESGKQFDSFKEGEILVAPETTPSFVPLMRKASAILTGKGGITSHAAIVSRELKKPCVIAIKDVTTILKNGDEVEVDADKGIVTILS
jgi:phosphohistidine swiveling domain-containing protein